MVCGEAFSRPNSPRYRSIATASSDMGTQVFFERLERSPAHFGIAGSLVTRRILQLGQEVRCDIGRLVMERVCARHISGERSHRSPPWERARRLAAGKSHRTAPRNQAGGDRFDVTFNARNLAREEYLRSCAHLECRREQRGAIDVSVAMHLAEAQKFCALQPWNQAQHPLLIAETHVVLKPHQVIAARARILLP